MLPLDRGDILGRGQTAFQPFETIPSSLTDAAQRMVGKEGTLEWFEDVNPLTGVRRSGNYVLCRLTRWTGTYNVAAKQLVHLAAGTLRTQSDRQANVTWEGPVALVDEYLPSTNPVRTNDCFWAVIWGPALAKTSSTAGALNVIGQNDNLYAVTANGTTATDAGHVATGAAVTDNILNTVGVAQSAMTTANTLADVLVFVNSLK